MASASTGLRLGMRESNIDASKGADEELDRIVGQIREAWPEVEILVRGDSGFCRESLMAWCEEHHVDYLFGIAKNSRLKQELEPEMAEARRQYEETGKASRVFKDFRYKTLETWSRERRVIGKAEHLEKGSNPRFVVTSLSAEDYDARQVYEEQYCIRGDMENRIKKQQLCLFADRTSTSWMRSNQLRLWFSSIAYTLVNALRHLALKGTGLERAQCSTIRTKLFKIGALVKISVRRVVLLLATGCPYQGEFASAYQNLNATMPLRC